MLNKDKQIKIPVITLPSKCIAGCQRVINNCGHNYKR